MKRLFPIFILSLFALVACDDDDRSIQLESNVISFIENRYAGAKIRHAEYESNGLIEVEIVHNSVVKDVYFNSNNEWVYTSWDVRVSDIPAAVASAVATNYPSFRIDDVDFIEKGELSYYRIEIERGNIESVVLVLPDGEFLDNPVAGPAKPVVNDVVSEFIAGKYPNATIIDAENSANGLLEVDILDGNIEKDVYFDQQDNWVMTTWDVSADWLPDAVNSALLASYPDYYVDDADYVESPDKVYYVIELEKGEQEKVVYVTPEGEYLQI